MSTITFENGTSVNFDGNPTPADIDEVASKLNLSPTNGTNPLGINSNQSTSQSTAQISSDKVDGGNTYGALTPASQGDESGNPILAGIIGGAKAAVNLPTSAANFAGNIVNAVMHPILTWDGMGNALAGAIEKTSNALGISKYDDVSTQTYDKLVNSLKDRYGSLDNLRKTATNDPFGFGSDVLAVLEGGATLADRAAGTTGVDLARKSAEAGNDTFAQTGLKVMPKVGEGTVSGALNSTLKGAADIVLTPGKKLASGAYDLGTNMYGKTLGVDGGTLKQGISATIEGGDAYKAFVKGLQGQTSQSELVDQARNALDEISATRSQNYRQMLSDLKSNTSELDMSGLKTKLKQQMKDFNITVNSDGTLNFDSSTLGKSSDQTAITKMYSDVMNWKDTSPVGVDILKQRLGNYWEPGSKTGAFSEGLRSTARQMLEGTPGYTDAMKNYSEMSDQITDIKRGLSLGDNAMVETTFKKLTGAFRQNNEFRVQLIQELDKATGGKLLPQIAGQQLSSWMPRGLMGPIEAGGGIFSMLNHGTGLVAVLATMMATSPKLVGEFIRTLGLPARGFNTVMGVLNKLATPAGVVAGDVVNRTSASRQPIPLVPTQ